MKKILFLIVLTLIVSKTFGQAFWDIDFEDTTTVDRVIIDTTSNINNIWQIGHPNKTIFNTAHSNPNAIVTDTANPYPTNDTSSFTVIHIASIGWEMSYPPWIDIGGYYYVNSDSLTDYGFIDFSPDLGNTWYLADSSLGWCMGGRVMELPTLTGNSNGWKHFYYCLQAPYPVAMGDTILYRFNFISDSIQTNKGGLMFDNLHFEDYYSGIEEVQNDNLISVFPNPASDKLRIHVNSKVTDKIKIQIFNYAGQMLYENENYKGQSINTHQFSNGIYFLKYSDTKYFAIKTFVIQH